MKRAASIMLAAALPMFLQAGVTRTAEAQVQAAPSLMNFQGRLSKPDGTPVADGNYALTFTLFDAVTGGSQKWSQSFNSVAVHNGVFGVVFSNLSNAVFNANLWLEIKVGNNAPLSPRQQLVSVAYAFKANTVPDSSIGTTQLANGAVTSAKLANNTLNTLAWLLGGNANVNTFLGTTDNKPLEIRVNNHRAMQYIYAENTSSPGFEYRGINILGGSEINTITPGVVGATLVGGGQDNFSGGDSPNSVTADYGTVVGGSLNKADGFSFVGGGYNNKATQFYSTIVGGTYNVASNNQTFIGGGIGNTASGFGAVVPGGQQNVASGDLSFAAGNGAQAQHFGSFVWADASDPVNAFSSTGNNQFLIRAAGGVGINNNNPTGYALSVSGSTGISGRLTVGNTFEQTSIGEFDIDAPNVVGGRMRVATNGWVGINTTSPQGQLHIRGNEGILNLEGVNHCYIQYFPRGFATGRKAYIGFPASGSHDLNIANEDGGAVRVIGTFINNSDVRYKTHIAGLENALDAVVRLRGVTYDWRQDMPGVHFTEQRQIGFIAQEVEQVLPDLVYTDTAGYKSVAYVNMVPVLVEAIKAQQKQIEGLQTQNQKVATLEAQIAALSARLAQLEKGAGK